MGEPDDKRVRVPPAEPDNWARPPPQLAKRAAAQAGHALGSSLHLLGLQKRDAPGAPAGIEFDPEIDALPDPGTIRVSCIDYCAERFESVEVDSAQLAVFLQRPRPEWSRVRWFNVDGLHPYVINQFRKNLGFHSLTAEDVLDVPQRPRFEAFVEHIFVVLRMITLADGKLGAEQVSALLFKDTLLTFLEDPDDVWEPLRRRLTKPDARPRARGADFLLYAQLDAIIDHIFPVLEHYGDVLEELEGDIMSAPSPDVLHRVQVVRRELGTLRRVLWPTREAIDGLIRSESALLHESTIAYLRDVYSHTVQCVDIIETYRDGCSALTDLYMSSVSNRMNEVMKVLTIMSSVFIPITFLAGVYGMNFDYMPELGWRPGYGSFWLICVVITGSLVVFFRRRGWL